MTRTRPSIHPGGILADELAELQIGTAQLGRELHVPTNRITQILAGKRAITADTALRLGQWFGTGPALWLNLQKSYDLRLAEQQVGREIRQSITPRRPHQDHVGSVSPKSSSTGRCLDGTQEPVETEPALERVLTMTKS